MPVLFASTAVIVRKRRGCIGKGHAIIKLSGFVRKFKAFPSPARGGRPPPALQDASSCVVGRCALGTRCVCVPVPFYPGSPVAALCRALAPRTAAAPCRDLQHLGRTQAPAGSPAL